jgi:hypothetical protein
MKSMHIILSILCLFSFSCSRKVKTGNLDSVIAKFQNDNRSFEEFVTLGKLMCYSKATNLPITVDGKTDLYFGVSSQLYNSLTPLARLFDEEITRKSLEEYFLLNIKLFEDLHYYKKIELCDSLFNKNESYKKYYLQFVSNKKNYLAPTNDINSYSREEIEEFQKDYLENYFINYFIR